MRRFFNFWPTFSDVLIFIILSLMFIFTVIYAMQVSIKGLEIKEMVDIKNEFVKEIAHQFNVINIDTTRLEINKGEIDYKLVVQLDTTILEFRNEDNTDTIYIFNTPEMQIIRFSESILFDEGKFSLKGRGRLILKRFGKVLKSKINQIRRIQIEGHTDFIPYNRLIKIEKPCDIFEFCDYKLEDTIHASNIHLGALRAIEVYKFLIDTVGIDPFKTLISVVSFGKYKPVNRSEKIAFTPQMLDLANADESLRRANRRVEIVLIYKLSEGGKR